MNLPGENTITLNTEALRLLVEESLNESRFNKPRVRVVKISRTSSFSDEIEFTVTTDPAPIEKSAVGSQTELPEVEAA